MSLNLVPRGVGCRDPSSQKDGTEGSLSMRRPNQRLPWPQSTGWLRSELRQDRSLPYPALLLYHCQDCRQQQHEPVATSTGGN